MEENLRKIHLESLLSTLEDSDKDKKIEICNIIKEMTTEGIENTKRNRDHEMTHFLKKLQGLLEKTISLHLK